MKKRLRDFYFGGRYSKGGVSFKAILGLLTRLDPVKFVVRPVWQDWDWFKEDP
jgi:hypothetical protein